jgi:chromosome partitioning protein
MAQRIAVLSQKGGTGKTTAVRMLTDAFRRRGVHTLAVDFDPQGNLSDYFDLAPDVEPTIADVLSGRALASEAVHGDIIPANLTLAEAELMLGGKIGREMRLKRTLAQVADDYDVILIDCPPSLGLLTVNALVAADWALITAEAQYFALRAVEQALDVVELARQELNPELSLLGLLLNVADMRTLHSREALARLKKHFGAHVFGTVVRASIAYAESAEQATSIIDHRPDLGADYLALADEVLERLPALGETRERLAGAGAEELRLVNGDLLSRTREHEPSTPAGPPVGPGPELIEEPAADIGRDWQLDRASRATDGEDALTEEALTHASFG